ncbi:uncharacterized protein [Blastocystis hominis]|uniref:ER lumen protein retaining receptor n=1 Tax=Blastocystis hominis TaxID=12968 RepID=D8LVZ5_BLAHO|nr:uncharacterized protein [Blastocystis hominis]CBK19984.2 unnamed protein product [Blastocystis hominis]|eukprot:XP_012894032.1 uncharacterized protein [Blastocystis hominis]
MYPPRTTVLEGSSIKLPLRFFQSSSLKNALSPDRKNLSVWLLFAIFVLLTFHYLSDRDFSFLLTLSSIVGSFGFLLGLYKVVSSRSVQGLSVKSLILYGVVSLSRFFSILFSDSYLPYDRSGDWVYRCTEGVEVIAIAFLLYFSYRYKYTYYSFIVNHSLNLSKLGFVCRRKQEEELYHDRASSVFAALPLDCTHIIHPGLSQKQSIDVLWSFSHYVEAIAVYPQLTLFSRSRHGEIEGLTSHFVFSLAISRLFALLFWASCWRELNAGTRWLGSRYAGVSILLSQCIQIVLMGEYVYYYVKSYFSKLYTNSSLLNGTPLVLPVCRTSRED